MNKVTIDRDRGAPLHHQIYLVLADGIATGRYAIGEAQLRPLQSSSACGRLPSGSAGR